MTFLSFAARVNALICLGLLSLQLNAQKTELRIRVGSGLFHYWGTGSTSTTALNVSNINTYLNNPIGTSSGFSYDLSGVFKRITSYRMLYGMEAGFLSVQSKVAVDWISAKAPDGGPAEGTGEYRSNFINLHPFIGYRIPIGKIPVDISFGNEINFWLKNNIETARVTQSSDGKVFNVDRERENPFRIRSLRVQLGVTLNRWGIDLGYSGGKMIDKGLWVGGVRDLHTSYLRAGISYRIN